MRRLGRRHFLGSLASLALALPACQRPAAAPADGETSRRRLVVATPWRGDGQPTYTRLLGRFAEAHPDVALQPVPLPRAELVGQAGADALWVDGPVVVEMGVRGVTVELSALASADSVDSTHFWAAAWAQGSWRGRIYGLPLTADPNFLLFRDRSVVGPELIPWAAYGSANALFTWAGAYGDELHDESADRVTADSPGVVAALEWMAAEAVRLGMRHVDVLMKPDKGDERHPFVRGKIAVAPLGSWELPELRRAGIDYEVSTMPGGAEWIGGWHVALTPRASRDDAWRFARWVAATRDGALAQGELNLAFSGYRDNPWLPIAERDPELSRYAQVLRRVTRHRPAHPAGGLFMELLDQAAEDAIRGRKPPAEALAMLTGATQRKLDVRKRGMNLA